MNASGILSNVFEQLTSFVGFVFFVGFLIAVLNRIFYSLAGNKMSVVYATGLIGTPIHELSHAIMCIIFGHKITEVRLFQIDSDDGTLGYVKHSYNPRNIYHLIGQYFIGVAPIFVGSIALYLAMRYFTPGTYGEVTQIFNELDSVGDGSFNWFANFGKIFKRIIGSLFSSLGDGILSWVFMLLSMCIALHMNLSKADVKGAIVAIPLIAILLFVVNFILGFISKSAYSAFIRAMDSVGIFIAVMLSLSLIFSVLCVAVAIAFRAVSSLIKR